MSTAQLLVAVALLAAVVAATEVHTQARSTSVKLEKRTRIVAAGSHRASTKVMKKTAYFARVAVGTPPQNFVVVYDTGSGNLLIPGKDCDSDACTKHSRFESKSSSTSHAINCDGSEIDSRGPDQLTITFGTGEVTGRCVKDKICVGTMCKVGSFISAVQESSNPFEFFQFDGVLGLALSSMAQSPDFSLMSRMEQGEALHQSMFAVFLSDSDQEVSEISFGEYKSEHMTGELFWVDVDTSSGYWEVKIDDIALDEKPKAICEDCRVAVDTGTSELAGPSEVISKLRSLLGVERDCSNFDKLPKLGFVITGHVMNLNPEDYVSKEEEGSVCTVSLMDLDVPPPKGPLFVFGIPFLQKYYSVYDQKNMKVGFGVAKHTGKEVESLVTIDVHRHKGV